MSEHLSLVRLHLRNRVPTPHRPRRRREYEDLFQEGCIALMRAARRFNPDRDGEFAAYALPRIRGAIFAALHRQFSLVRLPMPSRKPDGLAIRTIELTGDLMVPAPPPPHGAEQLGHAIRRRFERAVQAALVELRARRWRQRNPCEIIARLADERLLVPGEAERTPMRQIARESGVSSGRVAEYEQILHTAVRDHLKRDPQIGLLLQFARRDPRGSDGPLDAYRRERLREAELHAFEERFRAMPREQRAATLYDLIERSWPGVSEVARNLYCLAGLGRG